MIWPGVALVIAAYAVGTKAPGLIRGSSTMSTSGGTMLETLMRLTLPMPATRSALSNAFSGVPPSAVPAVTDALVTCFQNIATSPRAAPVKSRTRANARRAPPGQTAIISGAKVKRKHFFLALPCCCSIIQPTFAPCRVRRRRDRGDGERGAETASQFDDRRRSRARKGVGIGELGTSPAAGAVRLQL